MLYYDVRLNCAVNLHSDIYRFFYCFPPLLQDAALASEMAGEYFLRADDDYWSRHYLTQAFENYREWGASAKVDYLVRKHGAYIDLKRAPRRTSSYPIIRDKNFLTEDGPFIAKTVDFDALMTPTTPPPLSSPLNIINKEESSKAPLSEITVTDHFEDAPMIINSLHCTDAAT